MRRTGIYYHGGELPARSSFHGVTAETGLDALTHAVEAYIGRFYTPGRPEALPSRR